MRSTHLLTPLTLAAALGMLALPAQAHPAPPGKPAAKPAAECCKPGAACCVPGAACCPAGAHGDKDAKPGTPAPHGVDGHTEMHAPHGDGDGHADTPPPHGHPHGMRGHHGPRHGARQRGIWAGMRAERSHELRYMPDLGTGSSHLVLAGEHSMQKGDWLSLGMQGNMALQLNPAPGQGRWLSHYGGVLPKLGVSLGPTRLDVGSLVGLGAMARTTSVPGVGSDFLQFRAFWAVEPRVELGWKGDRWGAGLVGTYLLTPNMADLGGPSVGLQVTWGGGRRR